MSSAARSRRRRALRKVVACPDCNADVEVIRDNGPGEVSHVKVLHDDTCPTWRAQGAQPFHQVALAFLGRQ